jgi:excisionase family DNA binding protein
MSNEVVATLSMGKTAARFGCSKTHIKTLIDSGQLQARMVGRRWFIPVQSAECLFLGKCNDGKETM